MKLEQLGNAKKLAEFLNAEEEEVLRLLEESRLGGVLLTALRRRGVALTPRVKDSVQNVVRAMSPDNGRSSEKVLDSSQLSTATTTTILFTDLVDSTALTDRLGDREARSVLRIHDQMTRQQTRRHGGQEVKSMGDGFMLTFSSARKAVSCALAVQLELERFNEERLVTAQASGAEAVSLAVRMGLSVGEPVEEEEDLFGKSVILASRIADKASAGQVLTSQVVFALAGTTGDLEFREVGSFELKGMSGKHPLYEVTWRRS